MIKIKKELLNILWDSNGYNDISQTKTRILKELAKVAKISQNDGDFDKNIESLRITINNLPQKEIDIFEEVLNSFKKAQK